jgi:hypothetical protein
MSSAINEFNVYSILYILTEEIKLGRNSANHQPKITQVHDN